MFAFAIFDKINRTLTLARDAFGIKPIFIEMMKIAYILPLNYQL
jgi:asparagine synthetase B (glutamine-hydrolysing)